MWLERQLRPPGGTMVGASGERSRKPMLRRIAVVTIVLLAGLVAGAIAYRRPIAEFLLMRQLRDLGFDQAEFAIRRFNAEALEIENLSVGEGDGLDIARIEAHFSAQGLFASRLDALQISGLRLRGTLDEEGLSFGSLEPLFEGNASSANRGGPASLPATGIEIEDALLEIATAKGPLRASLELQAVEIAAGQLQANAELRVDHEFGNLDARLNATGSPNSLVGELELEAHAKGEFESNISTRAVRLTAKTAFSFEDGDIVIRLEDCAKIQIEELSVKSILTLSEPLDLCLRSRSESSFRISKEGAIETNLEVDSAGFVADLQSGDKRQRVSGELPALQVRASKRDDQFEVSLETAGGRLEFVEQAIEIRNIMLNATVSHGARAPKGHLRIEEIFDTQQVARFPKLALDAEFEPRDNDIGFTVELANSSRDLVIEIEGAQNLSDSAGRADLHLHAIDFNPGQLQPTTLFPILSDLLTEASGSIEMKGSVEWGTDGMRGTVEIAASNVSGNSELATVEHLNAIVELNEKGATLLDQIVSIGRLDFGLEFTDGLVHYRLEPGGAPTIESASWKFAGGELTARGEIDPRSENWETSLLVKGVNLSRLIELVNLEGLSGSGTLEGELPIALVEGEIEIRDAVLRSSGGTGIIRYRPDPGMANVAAADAQFATTLTVLENFHYERLEIEINGSATGSVVVQIHLAGANPDYQDGHPIEFNLSVDARLSDLLRTGMRIYRMPEKIEERLRAFLEKTL